MSESVLLRYLDEIRPLVIEEIRELIPKSRYGPVLYDLMLDYPLRSAKGLRPALAVATCRALGGRIEDVLRSAAVLELYHNAFLIHDDIEDGSLLRRGFPTLHRQHGVPIAINVGDAMLALALRPLLDNAKYIGLGKALRILDVVAKMALESAEGQAMELDWIRQAKWVFRDADYWHLVYKKTCWYTFIAPIAIGAISSGAKSSEIGRWKKFATLLGVSFQIQDDVLNLCADESAYGKEIGGDLWEGKRTLILIHAMRSANALDFSEAERIMGKPQSERNAQDVAWLFSLIEKHRSLDYAREHSIRIARRAEFALGKVTKSLRPSIHLDVLHELVRFVVDRDR